MKDKNYVSAYRKRNETKGIKRFEVKYLAAYPEHKDRIKQYANNLINKHKVK